MISALIASSDGPDAPPLAADLGVVGIQVLGISDRNAMLQDVIRTAPDLVIVYDSHPDSALFDSTKMVSTSAPRPMVVFTTDADAEKIAEATRSGVHAYVVNGYSQNRLRSVIHLAQARFRYDQLIRDELSDVNQKFAERKLVDRAKGILMGNRQLREEEAFRVLRSAAMHTKQRIGQVARQVIDSARYAEAINRAGQLRMLSQRLVKLYALLCADIGTLRHADISSDEPLGLFTDSIAQVDQNLGILTRTLSAATFGDLLAAVLTPWHSLRAVLADPPATDRLGQIDGLAETLLQQAEQLTLNLEVTGLAAALHVINVSGRQRMLSQRLAKAALMGNLLDAAAAPAAQAVMAISRDELVAGLDYLRNLPMTNAAITAELGETLLTWAAFEDALIAADRDDIASLSEVLLGHFDRLTDHLERAMQAMIS